MVFRLNVLFGMMPLLSRLPRERCKPPASPPDESVTVFARFCPLRKNLSRISCCGVYGSTRLLNKTWVIPGWNLSPNDHWPEVGLGVVGLNPFSPCPYSY